MKTCRSCLLDKPIDEFPKRTRAKDGRDSSCKACRARQSASYRERNPGKNAELCRSYYAKNRDDLLVEMRKRSKVRYENNRETENARSLAWAVKNREKQREHVSKWREANRDVHRKAAKAWRDNNPHLCRVNESKRRAAKLAAIPKWVDFEKISEIYAEARLKGMHVDHIVHLQSDLVCGLHVQHNLQLLTPAENLSKRNRFWPDMPA